MVVLDSGNCALNMDRFEIIQKLDQKGNRSSKDDKFSIVVTMACGETRIFEYDNAELRDNNYSTLISILQGASKK